MSFTIAIKKTSAEHAEKASKKPAAEPKQMLVLMGLICENCDKPTDRCEKKQGCGVCSACDLSKKHCACYKCKTCKNSTADCDCVCATCDFSVKDCICTGVEHSAYCAWCGRDPCCCDAEYQEYLSGKDSCIHCGNRLYTCSCYNTGYDNDDDLSDVDETACGICDNYHTGRKCPQEMTREDDE